MSSLVLLLFGGGKFGSLVSLRSSMTSINNTRKDVCVRMFTRVKPQCPRSKVLIEQFEHKWCQIAYFSFVIQLSLFLKKQFLILKYLYYAIFYTSPIRKICYILAHLKYTRLFLVFTNNFKILPFLKTRE